MRPCSLRSCCTDQAKSPNPSCNKNFLKKLISKSRISEKVNLTSLLFDMASDMHQPEHLANIPIGNLIGILVTKM